MRTKCVFADGKWHALREWTTAGTEIVEGKTVCGLTVYWARPSKRRVKCSNCRAALSRRARDDYLY